MKRDYNLTMDRSEGRFRTYYNYVATQPKTRCDMCGDAYKGNGEVCKDIGAPICNRMVFDPLKAVDYSREYRVGY